MAPRQKPNTHEAFKGLVFELCLPGTTAVGTLHEIRKEFGENEVVIWTRTGTIRVRYEASTKHWVII